MNEKIYSKLPVHVMWEQVPGEEPFDATFIAVKCKKHGKGGIEPMTTKI